MYEIYSKFVSIDDKPSFCFRCKCFSLYGAKKHIKKERKELKNAWFVIFHNGKAIYESKPYHFAVKKL